ncbi:tyrosine-type recombinase/integrase [Edwardsiella tarda]
MAKNSRGNDARQNLPDNLDNRHGFFVWHHPLTGSELPLGYITRREAIRQTREANHYLATITPSPLPNPHEIPTVSQWITEYLQRLEQRGVADNTLRARRSQSKTVHAMIGPRYLTQISTRDIAILLHPYILDGRLTAASLMRSFLNALFREAVAAGFIDHNPVAQTRTPPIRVKRRRLSEETLLAVYRLALQGEAKKPWLARGIELALLTGQRREDLCALRWQDVRENKLWLIQGKTGARLAITTRLHLQLGPYALRLSEVLDRCRAQGPSDYLLNSRRPRLHRAPGGPLVPDTLSKGFSRLLDQSGLVHAPHPPSFHEIRSLASRMYQAQYGTEFCQHLLGHKSRLMTEKYLDLRESMWNVIDIPDEEDNKSEENEG